MDEIKPAPESTINQHENATNSSEEHIALKNDTFEIHDSALGNDLPKGYYYNWRFIGVVIGSVISNNVYIMPYILSANAMPIIEADLGSSKNSVWVALAYTLCTAVCLLLFGRLTDIFGRRYFVIGAHTFGLVGCIIAGTANRIDTIVGGMVFAGLAAGVQQCWVVFLAELIPKKHRPITVATIYFTSIPGYGLTPAIARSLLVSTGNNWRWCFYICIILDASLVVIFTLCYFPPQFQQLHVHRSRWEQIKRIDFVGVFLFTAGLLLFLMGLSWGGGVYPWKSASVIATIVIGFCVLVAFITWEWFYKGDQILPLHLFKAPGFVPMTICASIGTCVAYSAAIIWPAEVNGLLPGSPETHGFLTSVQTSCTLIGMGVSGVFIRFLPYHKQFLIFSCLILTSFTGALASVQPGETAKACSLMAFAGMGIGLIESASRSLLPLSCPDEDIGAAIGVLGTVGYASAAVATAIYVTVLNTKVTAIVPGKVIEAALQAGLPKKDLIKLLELFSTNITAVPDITPEIAQAVGIAAQNGTADAFRYVWYTAVAFGLVATIASCFVISYTEYYTDTVARKMRLDQAQRDASALEHDTSEKV